MNARYRSIDGLRGFATLYILTFHQLQFITVGPSFIRKLILMGSTVVPLFFTVSGYLLFPRLVQASKVDPNWCRHFYIRRACRILPLWWVLVLAYYFVWGMSRRALLTNLTLTFGLFSFNLEFLPIIPAWSIFVEESFYLALPFATRFLRNALQITVALIAAILVALAWVNAGARVGIPSVHHFLERAPFANLHYFLVGILLAYGFGNPRFREWVRIKIHARRASILAVLSLACFFAPAYGAGVPCWVGSGLILFSALQDNFFSRALAWGPLRWAGERCYFIYIAQVPLSDLLWPQWTRLAASYHLRDPSLTLWWFPIFAATLFIAAEFSWRCWELPWQNLGKRWTRVSSDLSQPLPSY